MPDSLSIVHDPDSLAERIGGWRRAGDSIAFVPTMGNLHAGHLALVDRARELAPRVIVSIFVNPTQFGPDEDLDQYPRTFAADRQALARHSCDLIYSPSVDVIYPGGGDGGTRVKPPAALVDGLCGRARPGHFDGVATVVLTLFNQVRPDVAVFGRKDYQQLLVIRRMCADLSVPVRIESVATVREPSGLAMSSRNGYLNAAERHQAAALYQTLRRIAEGLRLGGHPEELREQGLVDLEEAGLIPEYLEILSADHLQPPLVGDDRVILAAARVGQTRLIDNLLVDEPD